MEFLAANPGDTVLGLREGCMFTVEDKKMTLTGELPVRLFRFNETPEELDSSHDFSQFLTQKVETYIDCLGRQQGICTRTTEIVCVKIMTRPYSYPFKPKGSIRK